MRKLLVRHDDPYTWHDMNGKLLHLAFVVWKQKEHFILGGAVRALVMHLKHLCKACGLSMAEELCKWHMPSSGVRN
jgi:hypothetical protein